MKNPEYFRLMKNGQFVGFKRIVTEYLPAGRSTWRLDQIEHDPGETQRLSRPALGIESLKRERISSDKSNRRPDSHQETRGLESSKEAADESRHN